MLMRVAITGFCGAGVALLWVFPGAGAPGQGPSTKKPAADAAAKAVKEDLDRFMAARFVMQEVKDEAVGRAFPNHVFLGVYFRQYPVAQLTPKGMNASNVYAVGPDGKARLLKEAAQLQDFFRTTLGLAAEADPAKDAARAYVRLLEDLHQDGFYKFALQDDSTKVEAGPEGKKATARAVVMAGGNGELGATLAFDRTGRLQTIMDRVMLKPGPRPICQATKLLDGDPIVRRMAERDLVIMGRAARSYLDEQRAQAAPELQAAIDRIWELILQEDR
jgi:hypothetical protein